MIDAEDLQQRRINQLVSLAWEAGPSGVIPSGFDETPPAHEEDAGVAIGPVDGKADEVDVGEFLNELGNEGWDLADPLVFENEIPTAAELIEMGSLQGTSPTPEEVWQAQRDWLGYRLSEPDEDVSWWGIGTLTDDTGRGAYFAMIQGGGSWTWPSHDLLGIFRTQSDAVEAVKRIGFTDPDEFQSPRASDP